MLLLCFIFSWSLFVLMFGAYLNAVEGDASRVRMWIGDGNENGNENGKGERILNFEF